MTELRLENPFITLTLDAASGAVTGIVNRATGTSCRAPGAGTLPFAVDAWSANGSRFIRDPREEQNGGFSFYEPKDDNPPGDLRVLREPVAPPAVCVEAIDGGQRAECAYVLDGGIRLTYTITLTDDSPVSEWQVRVENPGAPAAVDDLRVYRVAFPLLEGLCIGPRPADNFLARPYGQGELIPNPAAHDYVCPNGGPLKRHLPTYVLTYIGWASMPWLDLYGPGAGLYLASYDPTFEQVDLESWPDPARGTVTLDLRTMAYLEPGQQWTSQAFAVGVHQGDWHWAADTYRAWADAHLQPYEGPKWIREECDGWLGTGGPMPFEGYVNMLDDARWLGLNYLQIWSEMIEPETADGTRKSYYCFLLPDPKRGGEAALAAAVQAVRAAGGHIGFYYNIWTWDAEIGAALAPYRDAIPADVEIPEWWPTSRRWASVFPDGSRKAGNYVNEYAGLCPAAEAYQDYVISWVVDRYVKRYGVDTWYFDSMPVTMFGAARVCFSDEHGPAQPHGVGRGCLQMLRRVYEAAKPTELAITSETVSDAQMQFNSHALGVEMVNGLMVHPKPEIYSYTFPEHPIFSGTCNGAGSGLHYYYPELTAPRREDAMNRVFLMGYRFDILLREVDRDDPFHQYLRHLIALRQRVKDVVYLGEFRDDLGLGALPARTDAKLFRDRARATLVATLVDRREQRAPITLAIDLAVHGIAPPTHAVLYQLDGSETPLAIAMNHTVLTLTLPPLRGEAAAVRAW